MEAPGESLSPDDGAATTKNTFMQAFIVIQRLYQKLLDDSVPKMATRWVVTGILACIYIVRVAIIQGWYIVTYALGIYLLNLFIAFLSPRIDPSMDLDMMDDDDGDGPVLPVKKDEEFRPFIRRLPEFKFWYATSKAFLVALFCTFFSAFDIPVFWPILVVYFFVLFFVTMKRQIKHMIKYRYLPFSHGKKTFKGKEDSGKVIRG